MAKKKYNLTLAPFWTAKGGNRYMSIVITPEHVEAFKAVEAGGRLTFKVLDDEARAKDVSPNAYLEYITKADVEAYKAKRAEADSDVGI